MTPSAYRVRRATVDDLVGLIPLWESMHLNPAGLERRLTEFQIVETEEGHLLGALGLEATGRHGLLHSEAFNDFALADPLRALLWERMKSVAANLGLARLWTGESAPFWKREGFNRATGAAISKLPPDWAALQDEWLTIELRDEEVLRAALETSFARLKQEQGQDSQEILRRAQTLKYIAIPLVVLVVIACIAFSVYLLKQYPKLLHR